ncbi:50S ribosomal protein L6 [Candidatus Dependentiae bacterium]|nr:50S ribosomal protein L6 [Candidatus Dependentiae bacterium]
MSKIGRKPIIVSSAKVEVTGNVVTVKGAKATVSHELPQGFSLTINGNSLLLNVADRNDREVKTLWGLHRALLANKIKGVESGFEQKVKIVGLGFKAMATGRQMTFSLGYSHKMEYELPASIAVEIDKTGQLLTFKGTDKELLGKVCDTVRSFRKPEPYKGTGIMLEGEVIIRKAGKTKA